MQSRATPIELGPSQQSYLSMYINTNT